MFSDQAIMLDLLLERDAYFAFYSSAMAD